MSAGKATPNAPPNPKELIRQVQEAIARSQAGPRTDGAQDAAAVARDPALLGVLYALLVETQFLRKLTVFLLIATVAVFAEAVFEALLYFHLG